MKKVLYITYSFPPYGGPMVQRASKFTKYLHGFGYDPIVLTIKFHDKKFREKTCSHFPSDESLKKDLESVDLEIVRTESFEPVRFLSLLKKLRLSRLKKLIFLPDSHIMWLFPAMKAAKKIIKKNKIDIVYTSAPPHSINVLGLILQARHKIPWVADFRDPWTQNFIESWSTKLHYLLDKKFESEVYKKASKVIFVTPFCKTLMTSKFELDKSKVEIIPHGYDNEDNFESKGRGKRPDKFVISYVGRFYHGYNKDLSGRVKILSKIASKFLEFKVSDVLFDSATPYYFLKAVKSLLDKTPSLKEKIELRFIGPLDEKNKELIERFSLSGVTKVTGYIDHSSCVKLMKDSDLLLYIIGYSKKPLYTVASKIYEYMATGIPILGLVSEGDSKMLLERSGLATFAHPIDSNDIEAKVLCLYELWSKGQLKVKPNYGFIKQFERKKMTKKLAEVFDAVLK